MAWHFTALQHENPYWIIFQILKMGGSVPLPFSIACLCVGAFAEVDDPHKIVENHMAQFNMKWYIHENSPYEKMFRRVKSYAEVQSRFQTLPLYEQVGFLGFQKHGWKILPNILQGDSIAMPPS
jgi:hypothetical protein